MIAYGGDYNPEQWPREVWADDVDLMRRAKVNLVTVNVFSWARLEPRPGEYHFEELDDILDLLHGAGIGVDLATGTASPPPWMAHRWPETLPVTADGVRLEVGSRQQYCPSSPVYREKAAELVARLVDRYAEHPSVKLWHINNEYGCHVSHCYCPVSAAAFRDWLQKRYGTIDRLNEAWGTAFWSQRYDDFAEIEPPRQTPTFQNPTRLLDFDRFSNAELLECFRVEAALVRARTKTPLTTNFMGFFKPVNYWDWAAEVDVISDDCYPDPLDPSAPAKAAMVRDLMRSLGNGAPWILMEQAPSAVNWRPHNGAKAPGQMRALSHQAVARGADGVMFFQWRQSKAGSEKFHSGMVPHAGTESRVWREIVELGAELEALAPHVEGTRVPAKVAIVFDWESWWAIEQEASPSSVSYLGIVEAWHRAFLSLGVTIDFVTPRHDLSQYRVVIVPALWVATDADVAALAGFAQQGVLAVGFGSGILDENLHARLGGYLGEPLRNALGIWVEEFTPPPHGPLLLAGELVGGEATGSVWAEVVHAPDADVIATFETGTPAITRRATDGGSAWYVATVPDPDALRGLADALLRESGVEREDVPAGASDGTVEVVRRGDVVFQIDHRDQRVTVTSEGRDLV